MADPEGEGEGEGGGHADVAPAPDPDACDPVPPATDGSGAPDAAGSGTDRAGTTTDGPAATGTFAVWRALAAALRAGERRRFERELDGLVLRNRFTVAVVFPAVGSVMLVASALGLLVVDLPGGGSLDLNFDPYLVLAGVAVMRLPLVAGVLPLVDRRAGAAVGLLTLYAYGIEILGVTTGVPYGGFEYLIDLGPMLGGVVPLGLPVFFFPLVLNSYLLCLLLLGERAGRTAVRLPVVVAAVVGMDLVLDPAAVSLGFWIYDAGGAYYGVPLSNYAGWVVSAAVAVTAFDYGFDRTGLLDRLRGTEFMLDDLVSFVLLWGPINAFFGNWLPLVVAGLFGAGLIATDRFDFGVWETVPLADWWRDRQPGGDGRESRR